MLYNCIGLAPSDCITTSRNSFNRFVSIAAVLWDVLYHSQRGEKIICSMTKHCFTCIWTNIAVVQGRVFPSFLPAICDKLSVQKVVFFFLCHSCMPRWTQITTVVANLKNLFLLRKQTFQKLSHFFLLQNVHIHVRVVVVILHVDCKRGHDHSSVSKIE